MQTGSNRRRAHRRLRAGLVLASVLAVACGNRSAVEPPPPRESGEGNKELSGPPPPPEAIQRYDDAASLDPLTLVTLASEEGLSALLAEAAREPKHRRAVIAALPYTRRLAAAEYLSQVATTSEADQALAFGALLELAAQAKRNEDSEDLVELRRGCDVLAKLVTDGDGKKPARARALSVLRALEQHGCTPPSITDYDAK